MLVRRAQRSDERAIYDLVLYARRRVLLVEWQALRAALYASSDSAASDETSLSRTPIDLLCGEREGRVGALWASEEGPGRIAHLTALTVRDQWSQPATTAALLSGVKRALRESGLDQIAYLGVEPWLTAVLGQNGFAHRGSVITLQKTDENVPDWGSREVGVRLAGAADLDEILSVDERAFVPLWRSAAQTLAGQLSDSPFFVVAELRRRIVGSAYGSLTGRHGHLTRLVVDPGAQGMRIGVRLLAECVGFFQRQGVYGITLNTQKDNARACRLYRWFGFALLGREAEVWLCTL